VPEIKVQGPNSLLLIGDSRGKPPQTFEGLVTATSSCVAIGTLMEMDGPTRVRLLDDRWYDEPLPLTVAFDGSLKLPHGVLRVENVLGEVYLERKLEPKSVRLQIYVNHPTEPDQIAIVVRQDLSQPSYQLGDRTDS
jgi:hypothetical protein